MCVCPTFLVPYMIYPSLAYIHIYFLLQSSLAMATPLALSFLCSCRLQAVAYICIDNTGALKHLFSELNYNWHLWEKSKWLFPICLPSGRSAVGSCCLFSPSVRAWAIRFPGIAKDFLCVLSSLNFVFSTWIHEGICSGTLEVTVDSLQGEQALRCWTKRLDSIAFCFNW